MAIYDLVASLVVVSALGVSTTEAGGGAQDRLYFESINEASWQKAARDCKVFLGEAATLLYIETPEKLKNVSEFLKGDKGSVAAGEYWIGGQYNKKGGKFEWANGVAFGEWVPWADGHNKSKTPVTKVELRPVDMTFSTAFQTAQNKYLCEIEV